MERKRSGDLSIHSDDRQPHEMIPAAPIVSAARPTGVPWWQNGLIYQIYPLSFMDSNGDGSGDLRGIISRLDYCRWLGVEAVWLSPIYPSPMIDFGYDVSDFTDIHPLFGTLSDFDALISEARRLDLKVLLDYVPNHSSDQHSWFLQSRSSRNNQYRDWYIWRDPAPAGGPPNNWLSAFGGSAWEWNENTGQYYLHSYLKEQPDLNWRNSDVRQAMLEVLRFWLNRGVGGFRVDSIAHVMKDTQFRDNPLNPAWDPATGPYFRYLPLHSRDHPDTPSVVRRIRQVVDEYEDCVVIGEAYLCLERTVAYYRAGVHLPFNFALITSPWKAREVHRIISTYESLLKPDQWPNWVLGNHDRHLIATRVGRAEARVAAMLLLTLRGTPTLYYGDEISMQDVPIPAELIKDPWELNVPSLGLGRDPERSPMQWNSTNNAGFSTATPWLPVASDFNRFNVAIESHEPDSILTLYRRLIALRAEKPALHSGPYGEVLCDDYVLCYSRQSGAESFFIALNFTEEPRTFEQPGLRGRITLSTALDRDSEPVGEDFLLRPHEGIIVEIEGRVV
jgi:alpha-glucosidase